MEHLIKKAYVEEGIRPIARSLGLTLDQFTIKYALSYPALTLIITVASLKELEEYAGLLMDPTQKHAIREVEDAYAEFLRLSQVNGSKAH
mgnify:CR=1 FL=1